MKKFWADHEAVLPLPQQNLPLSEYVTWLDHILQCRTTISNSSVKTPACIGELMVHALLLNWARNFSLFELFNVPGPVLNYFSLQFSHSFEQVPSVLSCLTAPITHKHTFLFALMRSCAKGFLSQSRNNKNIASLAMQVADTRVTSPAKRAVLRVASYHGANKRYWISRRA